MRRFEIFVALSIIILSLAGSAPAQTLGTFTGAAASADGEGAVFMLAGNDAFRTGIAARFNVTAAADVGVQLGFDRLCEKSFWGGGADLKLVLLESRKNLPLGLALDASFGKLDSREVKQYLFGFGILASGIIETSEWRTMEPYVSFIVLVKQIDRGDIPRRDPIEGCLCLPASGDDTDARALVRAGLKLSLTKETQLLFETELGKHPLFGAGVNVVF
jgi:hypothetical protein